MNAKINLFCAIGSIFVMVFLLTNLPDTFLQNILIIINLVICWYNLAFFIEANVGIILVDNGFTIYKKERR